MKNEKLVDNMIFELNCRKYVSDCYKYIYWFIYI